MGRYITNHYRNTSSVSSMLDHLQLKGLESRRFKCQLTLMFKIVHGLVDILPEKYLTSASTMTKSEIRKFTDRSNPPVKNSFFPRTVCTGIPTLPVWLTFPLWYPSRGALKALFLKLMLGRVRCKNIPNIFVLCWLGLRGPWHLHVNVNVDVHVYEVQYSISSPKFQWQLKCFQKLGKIC